MYQPDTYFERSPADFSTSLQLEEYRTLRAGNTRLLSGIINQVMKVPSVARLRSSTTSNYINIKGGNYNERNGSTRSTSQI